MRNIVVHGMILAIVLAACGPSSVEGEHCSLPTACSQSMVPSELTLAHAVLDLVNQRRATAGLSPLVWYDCAAEVAYQHALDMDVRGFFSITDPDGAGTLERLDAAGLGCTMGAAEAIAQGQGDAAAVLAYWEASPADLQTLLTTLFLLAGVGAHEGVGGPWYSIVFVEPGI